jgi:hypothetical protein
MAAQVEPMKPTLKTYGPERLKLQHVELLTNFAFKFNLRRYNQVCALLLKSRGGLVSADEGNTAGRCKLTVSKPVLKATVASALETKICCTAFKSAFNLNLRRHNTAALDELVGEVAAKAARHDADKVGRCFLADPMKHTWAKSEAWCLLIHADASLSPPLHALKRLYLGSCKRILYKLWIHCFLDLLSVASCAPTTRWPRLWRSRRRCCSTARSARWQGLTLVHFPAQRMHLLWHRACVGVIYGGFGECLGRVCGVFRL